MSVHLLSRMALLQLSAWIRRHHQPGASSRNRLYQEMLRAIHNLRSDVRRQSKALHGLHGVSGAVTASTFPIPTPAVAASAHVATTSARDTVTSIEPSAARLSVPSNLPTRHHYERRLAARARRRRGVQLQRHLRLRMRGARSRAPPLLREHNTRARRQRVVLRALVLRERRRLQRALPDERLRTRRQPVLLVRPLWLHQPLQCVVLSTAAAVRAARLATRRAAVAARATACASSASARRTAAITAAITAAVLPTVLTTSALLTA